MDSSEDYVLTYEEYMGYLDDEPYLLNLGSAEEWPSLSEAYPAFFRSRDQGGNPLTDSAALDAYAKALDETLNGQFASKPMRPTYLAVLMGTASGRNSPTTPDAPNTSPEEEEQRPRKPSASEKIKHKLDVVRHKFSSLAQGFFQKAKHAFDSDKKTKKSAHDADDPEASKAEMSISEVPAKEEKTSGERKKKLERSKTESVKAEKAERKKLERSKTLEKSKSEKKEKAKKTSPRREKHEEAAEGKEKSKKAKKGTSPRPADSGKDTAEEITVGTQKSADKKDESGFSQAADSTQQESNNMIMATMAMGYVANDGVFLM